MLDQDRASAFWAEMSACEHFVQIYEADGAFMDTLAGFISGGLTTDQAAVVIATRGHRQELDIRLPGNANSGHEYGTDLSDPERMGLIEFLKTL